MAKFKGTPQKLILQANQFEANEYYVTNAKTGNWIFNIRHNGEQNETEQRANITLLLASYDLLKALQEMIRMYEKVQPAGGWQGVYEGAVYAVKKATK